MNIIFFNAQMYVQFNKFFSLYDTYVKCRFIYTGKLYINDSNVDGLLQLSNELQIPGLLFKCIDFLGRLPLAKVRMLIHVIQVLEKSMNILWYLSTL